MAGKRKKRRWSDEEKRSICFQTTAPGVSVAQVARRYAMNANLIFKWLWNERYAPEPDAVAEDAGAVFLPVEVPSRPIERGRLGPGLLAQVLVSKPVFDVLEEWLHTQLPKISGKSPLVKNHSLCAEPHAQNATIP